MNRFFSKLNLQDIKINPEGNRFPPDGDDQDEREDASQPTQARTVTEESFDAAPATAIEVEEVVEEASSVEAVVEEPVAPVVEQNGQHDVDGSNGHAAYDPATTTEYYADGEIVAVPGEVLKVSARSRPSAVAGAIAGVVREAGRAEVQAIGAGATNQAVKAVAIARDYLSETGIDAICVPAFIDVTIENEDRTAIRLVVEPRS